MTEQHGHAERDEPRAHRFERAGHRIAGSVAVRLAEAGRRPATVVPQPVGPTGCRPTPVRPYAGRFSPARRCRAGTIRRQPLPYAKR
ncbi:hypothetical protein STXM2123_314 [Streptomyces sp. F-3]|nr:hypothetical protein STXM2123_314 [Streptomyces sp. F-3]